MALSVSAVGAYVYVAKLAGFDAELVKLRETPLPWQWWGRPSMGLVLALASLSSALVTVDV